MRKITYTSLLISIGAFVLSTFLFLSACRAGFVYDFTGFVLKMENGTWSQAFHSFDYNVVQPFLQVFNLALFKLAGRSAEVYYFIFHLLLAIGIFGWSSFLLSLLNAKWVTISAMLLFVCSPYIVEVLVYDVCQAYLWSFVFLGFYHHLTLKFLQRNRVKELFALSVCLLLQLWTFDFILIYLPLTILLFLLVRKFSLAVLIVNLLVLGLYFIQNKLFLGSWVGHYGSEIHFLLDLKAQLGTFNKYLFKHVGLGQFFPYPSRIRAYAFVTSWIGILALVLLSILAIIRLLMNKASIPTKGAYLAYLFLASLFALLPVSNLYFQDLMLTENDRYGFLFGFVIMVIFAFLISLIRSRVIKYAVLAFLILSQLITQKKLINTWAESQVIVHEALSGWPDEFYDPSEKILLLNLPDNFHGVYLFRNLQSQSEVFEETRNSQLGDTTFADFTVALQMNMDQLNDGAEATNVGDNTLKVTLNQYGTWWWRNGIGATGYETEDYKIELSEMSYTIKLNNKDYKCYIWDDLRWHAVNIE